MPLAAVLFDKDGTLVDFDLTWGPAAYEVMLEMSSGDAHLLKRLAASWHYVLDSKRFRSTSPFIAGSVEDLVADWADALGRADVPVLAREIDTRLRAASLKAVAPIGRPLEVFAALTERGIRIGIATHDSEASARAHVAALELMVHIDFVAGYDSGFGGKPGPGMVRAFADQLKLRPSQIAVIGDSTHDMEAARAAGACAVAVLSGPARRPDLEHLADYVLDSIEGLPALVDRLRAAA